MNQEYKTIDDDVSQIRAPNYSSNAPFYTRILAAGFAIAGALFSGACDNHHTKPKPRPDIPQEQAIQIIYDHLNARGDAIDLSASGITPGPSSADYSGIEIPFHVKYLRTDLDAVIRYNKDFDSIEQSALYDNGAIDVNIPASPSTTVIKTSVDDLVN